MKRISYILIAILFLSACAKDEQESSLDIADSDVTCSIDLQFNFPDSDNYLSHSSARGSKKASLSSLNVNSNKRTDGSGIGHLVSAGLRVWKWYSPTTDKILHPEFDDDQIMAENMLADYQQWSRLETVLGRDGVYRIADMKFGYQSFIAQYMSIPTDIKDIYNSRWYDIECSKVELTSNTYVDKHLFRPVFKEYVGVTRGTTSSKKTSSAWKKEVEQKPFIPLTAEVENVWGDLNPDGTYNYLRPFKIEVENIEKRREEYFVNKVANIREYYAFKDTVVMDMMPMNSIIDIALRNESTNFYIAVLSHGSLFIVKPTERDTKRKLLNRQSLMVGQELSCKLFALKLKANVTVSDMELAAISSLEDIKNKFIVINGGGEGKELMPANAKILANQHYYVRFGGDDNQKKDQIKIITLTDDTFKFDANILVLTHDSLFDAPIDWNGDWN